jgi:hypothetical protein
VVGSLLVAEADRAKSLRGKAMFELMNLGVPANTCEAYVDRILDIVRRFL